MLRCLSLLANLSRQLTRGHSRVSGVAEHVPDKVGCRRDNASVYVRSGALCFTTPLIAGQVSKVASFEAGDSSFGE